MKDRFGREYLSSFIALRGRRRKAKKAKGRKEKKANPKDLLSAERLLQLARALNFTLDEFRNVEEGKK